MLTSVYPDRNLKNMGANPIFPFTMCYMNQERYNKRLNVFLSTDRRFAAAYPSSVLYETRGEGQVHVNGHHYAVGVLEWKQYDDVIDKVSVLT